jgi:carbon storage regulator
MLVLQRKPGQEIVIGGRIRVRVLAVHHSHVRLGFIAPGDVPIFREECLAAERPETAAAPAPAGPAPPPERPDAGAGRARQAAES